MKKKQNIQSFIKDYKVAAFASSSKFLIRDVLKEVGNNLNLIIEQGAGDGVMTVELLKHLSKNGKIILIEQNKDFVKILKELKLHDNRIEIFEGFVQDFIYPPFEKGGNADLIISSIPFSFLKTLEKNMVVKEAQQNLKTGGKLIIFHQYSLIMADMVKKVFGNVKSKFVARNFLPCFIIIGKKS